LIGFYLSLFFYLLILPVESLKIEWGFFAHRKINYMAVFSLPEEMFGFYKTNIDYLSEHAIDPDKRRYVLKNEFSRHYIDLDHWEEQPFDTIPRKLFQAVMKYGRLIAVCGEDTFFLSIADSLKREFYFNYLDENPYDSRIGIASGFPLDSYVASMDSEGCSYSFENNFVSYGVLPYFLESFYTRLVLAFQSVDKERILKVSSDLGHYIADAHVPLHTTENYNGQLTNQDGIHAFWESRLPELFADDEYDYMAGKAEYINDKHQYIWNMVMESHSQLEKLLRAEKELKSSYKRDQIYCFEERSGSTLRMPCREYAKAYHRKLNGMVESRMRASIKAVADFWYSAWLDAGQPVLEF